MRRLSEPFLIVLLASVISSSSANALTLICEGQGYAPEISTGFAFFNNNTGGSAWGSGIKSREAQFRDSVEIRIEGASGAIQLPPVLVPKINLGGQQGWWKLAGIQISDAQISAHFSLNFVNSPTFQIDRYTGRMRLVGFKMAFSGDCKAVDTSSAQKKF